MATTLDCELTGDIYASPGMRKIFDARRRLQGWLDAEAALAEAEADAGVIPQWAAARIRAVARAENFDLDQLADEIDGGRRHLLFPMVQALTAAAGEEAGRYVHWGATTQDILDTGLVLQLRDGLDLLEAELRGVVLALTALSAEHKTVAMAGRTHWQHALPITLGLKFAIMLDELRRHVERLATARDRVLVAQLAGGGGTLASLGEHWRTVQDGYCRRLGLARPTAPWFASRDRGAELVSVLGMVAATVERIVLTVGRLSATEIRELGEPLKPGQVGSSTMPQKRNPIFCERTAALCKLVRGLVPVAQEAMVVEHDRDMATYMAEWFVVPQIMIMAGGAVEKVRQILEGLHVDVDRMQANLEITGGGIVAEAVMFGLAEHVGRGRAHEITMAAAKEAAAADRPLLDVLRENEEVVRLVDDDRLRDLVDPAHYLGNAVETVEEVLAADSGERSPDERGG